MMKKEVYDEREQDDRKDIVNANGEVQVANCSKRSSNFLMTPDFQRNLPINFIKRCVLRKSLTHFITQSQWGFDTRLP